MMSRTLYDALIYFVEMLIAFAFFSRNYEIKIKLNHTLISGTCLFLLGSIIFSYFGNEVINLSLFFLINLIFAMHCFKIKLIQAIIYSILLDVFMFASELLVIFCVSSIFDIDTALYKNNLFAYIILSSISKLLYLAISQLLSFIVKKENWASSYTQKFSPLFIFPILTIVELTVFLFIALENDTKTEYQIVITVISILSIFSSIFIFIYYQILADNEAKIKELETERNYYNLNNTYMDVLQHQNNELQMMFHDTKHHYLALSNFEKIEDVKKYISEIYPELEQKNIIEISNNKMLDLIISKYIVICKTQGIKFNYEVKTANLDYIDDAELSIILNNLMDNALEAAVNSQEKQIELTLKHINNMDVLSVLNSCDNAPKHHDGQLITTKFDSGNHGFGTKIIKKHVKKNNGKYEWFYDENERRFHSTILFQKCLSSGVG